MTTMRNFRPFDVDCDCRAFFIEEEPWQYFVLESEFPSYVYVIQAGKDGPVKIGSAQKPSERLQELQTSNWHQLYLRAVVPCGPRVVIEKVAHALADRHRIRGEWFDLEPLKAVEFVVTAMALKGLDPKPLADAMRGLVVTPDNYNRAKRHEPYDSERRIALRQRLGID